MMKPICRCFALLNAFRYYAHIDLAQDQIKKLNSYFVNCDSKKETFLLFYELQKTYLFDNCIFLKITRDAS